MEATIWRDDSRLDNLSESSLSHPFVASATIGNSYLRQSQLHRYYDVPSDH